MIVSATNSTLPVVNFHIFDRPIQPSSVIHKFRTSSDIIRRIIWHDSLFCIFHFLHFFVLSFPYMFHSVFLSMVLFSCCFRVFLIYFYFFFVFRLVSLIRSKQNTSYLPNLWLDYNRNKVWMLRIREKKIIIIIINKPFSFINAIR